MDIALTALLTLGAMVLLAAAVLWLNDRFFDWRHRDRRTPEEVAADAAKLRHRLESPDWEAVERATGGRPSPAIRGLYQDSATIHRRDFWVRNPTVTNGQVQEEHINEFLPADSDAFNDPWYQDLPRAALPFATDMFGDILFVELTSEGTDGPVKHLYHDGGDIPEVAPTLATFLTWERVDEPHR